MIDERLKRYFTILRAYHNQDRIGRVQMLSGFFRASSLTEKDSYTRGLLIKFQYSEGKKYVPANQDPEPPRFA